MNPFFTAKHYLKVGRWQALRTLAAIQSGPRTLSHLPAVLGNAMPKSGSHLINQVLQGLTHIGPFINPGLPPVNRAENNARLPANLVLRNIEKMRPGDLRYGYIQAREPFLTALTGPGRATLFIYRDPRDMIVSHVFYATQIHPGHTMHRYYTESLHSMEERINAAILGVEVPGFELSSVRSKYENYLGWLDQPEVLSLRFEDLILDREAALARLLDYLERGGFRPKVTREAAVAALQAAIQPKKSGTFRKAKPGNWREHFTEANKEVFKQATGDLLARLKYEEDDLW